MIVETKTQCPKCGSAMQIVKGGITRCQTCGWQPGRRYRGSVCPNGCDPQLRRAIRTRLALQSLSADWLV